MPSFAYSPAKFEDRPNLEEIQARAARGEGMRDDTMNDREID